MASHQGTDAEVRQTLEEEDSPRSAPGRAAPKRGGGRRTKASPPPPANDAAFGLALKVPPLLELDQGATRVPRALEHLKADELWQGNAYQVLEDGSTGEDHAVYFRLAGGATLAAELLGALLAQALGLPTPQPYVLRIQPGVLPDSRWVEDAAAAPLLCVATQDLGGRAFGQLLAEQSEAAKKLLRQWHALLPTATFDEWIANLDRNFGNILFAARELWLIDHADAFGGPQRRLLDLHEMVDKRFTNKLAILFGDNTPTQRRNHLEAAHRWLNGTASTLDLQEVTRHARHWQSAQEAQALHSFLAQRLRITHRLLCERLGYPQLALQ